MLKMEGGKNVEMTMESFIQKYGGITDACCDYEHYSKDVQQSLKNVYVACWRFGLRKNQILYTLNQMLKPFDKVQKEKKDKEVMNTLF